MMLSQIKLPYDPQEGTCICHAYSPSRRLYVIASYHSKSDRGQGIASNNLESLMMLIKRPGHIARILCGRGKEYSLPETPFSSSHPNDGASRRSPRLRNAQYIRNDKQGVVIEKAFSATTR